MWENFIGMCKLYFMDMARFCGHVHERNFDCGKISSMKTFVGYVMLVLGKFCGYDFGYVRIYLCMGMNLWEFFSWTCRNFFAWLWENLVVVYGCVEDFDCGEILVGH